MQIVHIEDDRPLKEILKAALQTADPNILLRQFSSADEALSYIEQHCAAIDLYIIDIKLQGESSGIDLAKFIRRLNCPGSIVLTSAYSRPSRTALEELNAEYLPKPWHVMELAQKLLNYRLPSDPAVDDSLSANQPVDAQAPDQAEQDASAADDDTPDTL
jgi:two-component SAPR family response regulator